MEQEPDIKLEDSDICIAQFQQEKLELTDKLLEVQQLLDEKENLYREQHFKLLEANKQISDLETTIASLKDEIEIFVKMMSSVALAENKKQESTPSPPRQPKLLRIKDAKIESLKQQNTKLGRDMAQLQKTLLNEKQLRLSVEKSVMRSSEISEKQIEELTARIDEIQAKIKEDRIHREIKEAEDNENLVERKLPKVKNQEDASASMLNESENSSPMESETHTSEQVKKDEQLIESIRSKSRNIIRNLKDKLRSDSTERPQSEDTKPAQNEHEKAAQKEICYRFPPHSESTSCTD